MPLKDGQQPPYCINHPGEPMNILGNLKHNTDICILFSAKLLSSKPLEYELVEYGHGVIAYSCKICGYCEMYLLPDEFVNQQS